MIHLAGIEGIDYIVPAIAEALRFPISESNDPLDQLINYLNQKKILLFLDNFEHLQSGAIQLSSLLQHCPHLKLLVTSRQQLHLAGEYILLVEGLALTENSRSQSSAVKLFEERAGQLAPNLDIVAERPYIKAICRLVGGMPLAIEMCAAWIQTINCQEILVEIERGLDLLEGRQADLPNRHHSIRAVFRSYFGLLQSVELETLLTLAVFRGSFTYTAAKQVAGASLMQLRSLVEKSLLSSYGAQAQTRYQIHPLLRQYSIEQITAEKLAQMRRRHAQYFSALLFELDKKRCGVEIEQIVPEVIIEIDNLRSVWNWFGRQIAANEETELVCRLLEQFLPAWSYAFWRETRFSEGKQLLNTVWPLMEKANWETAESPEMRWAFALTTEHLAQFCVELSQFKETVTLSKRALSIMRPLYESNFRTDKRFLAETLRTCARADIRLGDYPGAKEKLQESINEAPGGVTEGWSIYSLATLYSNIGQYDKALANYPDAMALFEACHDQSSILTTTSSIGTVYARQRNFEKAIEYFEKVVAIARQMNQRVALMIALSNLAFCLRRVGRINRVGRYFEEALEVAKELGTQRWQAVISQDFGMFLLEHGDINLAKQHLQAGLAMSVSINSEPDALAGLLSMAEYQAQIGRFEEALTAAGFVMNNHVATEENRSYAADFWDELTSELPPIFTARAKAKLQNATFDDILAMMPSS
jgi:predicted ATPase/Tfp pilus assembly protein PilF